MSERKISMKKTVLKPYENMPNQAEKSAHSPHALDHSYGELAKHRSPCHGPWTQKGGGGPAKHPSSYAKFTGNAPFLSRFGGALAEASSARSWAAYPARSFLQDAWRCQTQWHIKREWLLSLAGWEDPPRGMHTPNLEKKVQKCAKKNCIKMHIFGKCAKTCKFDDKKWKK